MPTPDTPEVHGNMRLKGDDAELFKRLFALVAKERGPITVSEIIRDAIRCYAAEKKVTLES